MRENRLRTFVGNGGKAINGWLSTPGAVTAEVMARVDGANGGFDSLTIDLQHGLIDYSDAVHQLQAIGQTDVTPLARVPWLDNAMIMKLLDAGAYGIICPMINTADDCENFVQACSYAPRGRRSFGPTRALMYAGADYQTNANAQMLKIAMIETVEAMDNMEAIISTPDLDGIYVGPSDLGLSMGYPPGLDPETPEVVDAIMKIHACVKKHGLISCIHTGSAAYAKRMHEAGFDLVSVSSDARLLTNAAQDFIAGTRGAAVEKKVASY